MKIVDERVKPERLAQKDAGARTYWWRFIRPRPELHAVIAGLDWVLVVSRVGQQAAFTYLSTGMVFAESIIVFPLSSYAAFLCPPVPTTRNMDSVLWVVHEGRPSLHALGLFRDPSLSLWVGTDSR